MHLLQFQLNDFFNECLNSLLSDISLTKKGLGRPMKKTNKRKTFIRLYVGIILMTIVIATMPKITAAGHGVEITSPENNRMYSNIVNKKLDNAEQTYISFSYDITNADGYYAFYETYIDDRYDPELMIDFELGRGVFVSKRYNAQTFLDRYGQGKHTFAIWCYHRISATIGLAEGYSSDDDIVQIGIYKYRISIVSVDFSFNPVVVHYLGFWFTGEWNNVTDTSYCNFSNNIFGFHDLFWNESSHYLHGAYISSGEWTGGTVRSALHDLAIADDWNDIDIIHFATHGAGVPMGDYGIPLGALRKCTPLWEQWTPLGWYSKSTLKEDLLDAQSDEDNDGYYLDSERLLLIVDACYSGGFTSIATEVNYLTVFTAAKKTEKAVRIEGNYFDPGWTLEKKLNAIANAFTRALAQAIYFGNDLGTAWEKLGYFDYSTYYDNYYGPIHPWYDTQHPQRSEFSFESTTILYIYEE